MSKENISSMGDYLVNGLGGGGFRLQSFSPITTLKGGSIDTNGFSSVADYILGGNTFAIPSYAYSGGKKTLQNMNEPVYNNNGEISVIDDDLHKKLLELAKDDTNTDKNTKHGTKKRKKELHHLLTRKKYANNVDKNSKNNKTRRQPK